MYGSIITLNLPPDGSFFWSFCIRKNPKKFFLHGLLQNLVTKVLLEDLIMQYPSEKRKYRSTETYAYSIPVSNSCYNCP